MNEPSKIRIEHPCPMVLSKMKTEDGFYCKSCAKNIVDFRGKSQTEIKREFKENQCGIFDEQIVSTPTFGFKYKFLFKTLTLLSLIGFNIKPLYAQETKKQKDSLQINNDTLRQPVIGKITIEPKRDTLLIMDPDDMKHKKRRFFRRKKKVVGRTIGCPSF